ncbi:dihydrofolate reductase family protein [Hyphomicrobium sp. NDB2Meth4]|uniref:dihydrofolate reductase family protein n=1 Tax=Hyphomicrobium sp. NDB2Meth4 TaxID=1892846 RepID=UPI000930D6EA|nr:dihydrofolate reductase family protein [Hyphomicrobium sp. NDB2Meth4]
MGKLVLSMFISLDGYIEKVSGFAGPTWSGDLEKHWSGHALARAKHLVYGRKNFLFNKSFWSAAETDPTSVAASISYAGTMNSLPKTVLSTTLTGDPGWNGKVVADNVAGEMARLKREVDGDVFCFGGAGIANSLMRADVIDEYRFMVTPSIFGGGKRLFEPGMPEMDLKLIDSMRLDTGAVVLRYDRVRN